MGSPIDDYATYIEGSPNTYAKNLKGNLLLVHGTGDDNDNYQALVLLCEYHPNSRGNRD